MYVLVLRVISPHSSFSKLSKSKSAFNLSNSVDFSFTGTIVFSLSSKILSNDTILSSILTFLFVPKKILSALTQLLSACGNNATSVEAISNLLFSSFTGSFNLNRSLYFGFSSEFEKVL